MFADGNRVRQLLRELFFENQTFQLPTFVTSAFLDQRRAARTHAGLVGKQLVLTAPRLPKALWINCLRTPLEIELVSWVFSNLPVLLISSGAGSGKSSALQHLMAYARELEASLRSSNQALPAGALLRVIDFQDAPDHLKHDVAGEKEKDQSDDFIDVFCQRLDTVIAGFPAEARQQAFTNAFKSGEPTGVADATTTSVATGDAPVRKSVARAAAQIWQGTQPPADLVERALATGELSSSHDKAVARLLLLQAVADLQKSHSDFGFVLVIDNVDPFPEYLQTALMKTIQAIVYGMNASSLSTRSNLSISVFARLSTSSRQSGAMDGVEAERYSFSAADPADIVFFRLAAFVRQPDSLSAWPLLGEQDQHEVLARSLSLLERLLDSRDQFFRVFSALAGTNIRTACKFARKWVLTPRLDGAGYRSLHLRPEQLGTLIAFSMVFRVALAVERALLSSHPTRPQQDLKSVIVERFYSHLLGILWSTGIVALKEKRELSGGPRLAVPLIARGEIETLLASEPTDTQRVASPVARAADQLTREASIPREKRLALSNEIMSALRAMEVEMAERLKVIVDNDISIAKGICAHLIEAVGSGIAGGFSERSVSSILENEVGITTRSERAVPSRWEAVSILISGSQSVEEYQQGQDQMQSAAGIEEAEVLSVTAVNVFSSDKAILCPIALHVLCILKEANEGVDAVSLMKQLRRWGFDRNDIIAVLSEMVDIDRRLIFSAVKDAARGVAQWFDGFHKVHISSAGLGYLEAVVSTPAYLQWALLEIGQMRETLGGSEVIANGLSTGLRRLALAHRCLDLVAQEEQARLKKLLARGYTPFSSSLSPFSCVFFRSLGWFVEDLSGLKRANYRDALSVARSFVRLGQQVVKSRMALLGMMDNEWGSDLLLAKKEVRIRFQLPESEDFSDPA